MQLGKKRGKQGYRLVFKIRFQRALRKKKKKTYVHRKEFEKLVSTGTAMTK